MMWDGSSVKRAVPLRPSDRGAATYIAPDNSDSTERLPFVKGTWRQAALKTPFCCSRIVRESRKLSPGDRYDTMERRNDGTARLEAPEDAALSVPLYVPSPLALWNGR